MTTTVKFPSRVEGQLLEGALAEPAGSGKAGGVIVLQEWHGVNDVMRTMCDRFAEAGFVSLAPDLYHGKVAKNDEEAGVLMGALDWPRAVGDVGDAATFLRGHARCNGKVAVTGFCMGGALTLAAAYWLDGLACAVPFYGLPHIPVDKFEKVKTPIQAHFAKVDEWAKASVAEQIQKKVRAGGGHMDLFVYDAGHAFMRASDPTKYAPDAASVAWERATKFLRDHLA